MTDSSEKGNGLLESPVFDEIPQEKLALIAKAVQEKVVPAQTVIFRQGDPGDSFYVIKSGRVRAFRKDADGVETDLSELGPGESFGEMALLTGEPRSANVAALEETRLAVLSKDQFDRILKDYPRIALSFVKQMSGWLLQDEIRLEKETQRQFKAPRLSWFDYLGIFGITLLCGVIFNLSNPNGISLLPQSWSQEPLTAVSLSAAAEKFTEGHALFVDARPANFYEQEHIKGAVNIPLPLFDIVYLMELGEEERSKEIIVYGRNISRLYDEQVARKLRLRGHEHVKILQGGLPAWKKTGYPIES